MLRNEILLRDIALGPDSQLNRVCLNDKNKYSCENFKQLIDSVKYVAKIKETNLSNIICIILTYLEY